MEQVKFRIDECLHVSLVAVAHSAGYAADHVSHRGLRSFKDWQLMQAILEHEYVFVTNDRADFLKLYAQEPLHPGLILLIPCVSPVLQCKLFEAALARAKAMHMTNTVVEVVST